jgi:hypothetical protein
MKHVIFFFLLAMFTSLTAQSQDTTDYHLEIVLQDEYGIEITEVDSIRLSIFNEDTIFYFENVEYSIQLDLPEGKYSLKAECDGYYSTEIKDIEVRWCCLSQVLVVLNHEDKLCDTYPSRVYEPTLMRFYFDYDFNHPSFGNNDGAFKNGYQIRMSNHNMFGVSKRWDLGTINSFDWGWQQIDSLVSPAFESELNRARYSWFKWGLGVTNTLMISGVETEDERDDFILNFGATWNMPIMFRYTEVNGNTKQFKRGIHKWNELEAEARLTYGAVGFGATYRLTEYLKGDFPEMPRLMLSLTLTAPTI